jgi:radical SAM superfamily enzyme YgiQ (UPF0313 family)
MNLRLQPAGEPHVRFFNCTRDSFDAGERPAIVLIRPNETRLSEFYSAKFWENLGVLTLATHLEQSGIAFGVLEASLFQCSRAHTIELATEHHPGMIGISVFSTDMLDECLQLAAGLKTALPDVLVVLGGHGASFVHREILEHNPAVDAVVRGEGEDALLGLVRCPASGWSSVPNLAFRRDGAIVETPKRPPRDLDETPRPHRFARDLIARDPILSKTPLMMLSSRGCFDRCSFCTVTQFNQGWRGRSPRLVVDELEDLVSHFGRTSLHFWDDTFIGPGRQGQRRAIEIADEIVRRGLNVTFHVTTRPTDLKEDVVAALSKAGLRSVFIGVESADQRVLDAFDKHAKVEDSAAAVDLLWRYGVHRILLGFILFHPAMSWEGFERDLAYLCSLPYVSIHLIASRLMFFPGSRFWNEHKNELGVDAYKKYVKPRLPDPRFERLYRVCVSFLKRTLDMESIFVCVEEQYLHDQEVIDFIARLRVRLFHIVAARVRAAADLTRDGSDAKTHVERWADEIFYATLETIRTLHRRIATDYLKVVLTAYSLAGYEQLILEDPAAPEPQVQQH